MNEKRLFDVNGEYINDYSEPVDSQRGIRARVYQGAQEIQRFSKCSPEIKQGVYIAIAEEGRCFTPVYIGRSNNINQRICHHTAIEWRYLIVFDFDDKCYSDQVMLALESKLMLYAAMSEQYRPLNRKLSTKDLGSHLPLFCDIVDWLRIYNFDFLGPYSHCNNNDDARDYTIRDLVGINTSARGYEVLRYGTVTLCFRYDSAGNVVVLNTSRLSERYAFEHEASLASDYEQIQELKFTYEVDRRAKFGLFAFKRNLTFKSLSAAMSIAAIDDFAEDYDWFRNIWHPFKWTIIDDAMIHESQSFWLYCANWNENLDFYNLLQFPRCSRKERDVHYLLGRTDLLP